MVSKYPLITAMLLMACHNNSASISKASAETTALKKKNIELINAEQFRKHWKDYVSLKITKCEKVMFGGFKRVEISLFNDSPYMIDSISLRVNYFEEKKLYKSAFAVSTAIEQGETTIIDAPFSARGDSLNYAVEYLKASDAKLEFKAKKLK